MTAEQSEARPKRLSEGARMGLELGPLVAFFATNYVWGLFPGTAVLIATTLAAIAIMYGIDRRVPVMPAVSCVMVTIFGGLTLILADEMFIKLKPTVVNLLFAAALTFGVLIRRNFLQLLFGTVMSLDEMGWKIVTRRWIVMFCVLAAVNEFVWRSYDTDTWVTFKTFGVPVLVVIFSMTLVPVLQRHRPPEEGADD